MNELKFNSQICTTREQSQRLLDLGLKLETADMYYSEKPKLLFIRDNGIPLEEEDFPAWSLHRLLEIYSTSIDDTYVIMVYAAFNDIIKDIEYSINKGYFNKEYLKQ